MKTIVHLSLALLSLVSSSAFAGYYAYPPTSLEGVTYFEDSDNEKNAKNCRTSGAVCVRAGYLPKGISLAKNSSGFPMLSQGLFFSSTNWQNHRVIYNLTLEPDFSDVPRYRSAIVADLARKYELAPENVSISPINIGRIQFIVRSNFRPLDPSSDGQLSTFTEAITPQWTGDFHGLGSRFSISIQGNVWELEPGLKNLFMNQGGNAVVGQVSFNIPVKARAYNAKLKCKIGQFQEKFRSTVKSWHITRISRRGSYNETFNNDEKNAIRSTLRMEDFCQFEYFEDTTIPNQNIAIREKAALIFDRFFELAFKEVHGGRPDDLATGRDPKYTYFESVAGFKGDSEIELTLNDERVFNLSSDLDFYAGGVTESHFSPSAKYLCEQFERFDLKTQACSVVCQPGSEVYLPKHPQASKGGCVNIESYIAPTSP